MSIENEFTVIVRLFFTNLIVTFGAIVLGFIPFLFLSVGPIVGLSICTGIVLAGNELFLKLDYYSFLLSIVPHNIFEIPANIYASSIGIYLTIQTSKMIIPRFRSKAPSLQTLCNEASHSFILVVVPSLIIAAFVEVLVTPRPLYTLF
jgi:stage II sporulation protein M